MDPRFQEPSFTSGMPDLVGFEMGSRATSGSPSTGSSSHQQGYPGRQPSSSHNPVHKLDDIMFPSDDPFAYPNQPMMELGFQAPVSMSGGQHPHENSQFFMPTSMGEMDNQLLGQPPPYMIQHPEGQPGLEFSTLYDPNLYNVPMGQHPPSTPQQHMQPHQGQPMGQPRRAQPRRQERRIDQIFTENGMQADWGGFFGSGRGVFQGL